MKALLVITGIVGVLALAYVGTYNSLVGLREEAVSASSKVQNACQRQADLVPNLVKAVKSYAAHEEKVLTAVTEARAKVQQAAAVPKDGFAASPEAQKNLAEAQQALRGAILSVVAVAEKYPDWKASGLYQEFMAQLEGSQNRITRERDLQIDAAKSYNNMAKALIASTVFGRTFPPMDYYEAPVGEKSSVEVDL